MRPVGTALFLDFELLDECSEMRGGPDSRGRRIVLVLQAPSNCRQTNPSRMPVACRPGDALRFSDGVAIRREDHRLQRGGQEASSDRTAKKGSDNRANGISERESRQN
jgi:hypothetical protein